MAKIRFTTLSGFLLAIVSGCSAPNLDLGGSREGTASITVDQQNLRATPHDTLANETVSGTFIGQFVAGPTSGVFTLLGECSLRDPSGIGCLPCTMPNFAATSANGGAPQSPSLTLAAVELQGNGTARAPFLLNLNADDWPASYPNAWGSVDRSSNWPAWAGGESLELISTFAPASLPSQVGDAGSIPLPTGNAEGAFRDAPVSLIAPQDLLLTTEWAVSGATIDVKHDFSLHWTMTGQSASEHRVLVKVGTGVTGTSPGAVAGVSCLFPTSAGEGTIPAELLQQLPKGIAYFDIESIAGLEVVRNFGPAAAPSRITSFYTLTSNVLDAAGKDIAFARATTTLH